MVWIDSNEGYINRISTIIVNHRIAWLLWPGEWWFLFVPEFTNRRFGRKSCYV